MAHANPSHSITVPHNAALRGIYQPMSIDCLLALVYHATRIGVPPMRSLANYYV